MKGDPGLLEWSSDLLRLYPEPFLEKGQFHVFSLEPFTDRVLIHLSYRPVRQTFITHLPRIVWIFSFIMHSFIFYNNKFMTFYSLYSYFIYFSQPPLWGFLRVTRLGFRAPLLGLSSAKVFPLLRALGRCFTLGPFWKSLACPGPSSRPSSAGPFTTPSLVLTPQVP